MNAARPFELYRRQTAAPRIYGAMNGVMTRRSKFRNTRLRNRIIRARHTEFAAHTFYLPGDYEHPFNETAIEKPSRDWLKNLAGRMIAAGRPTMRKARIGVRRLRKAPIEGKHKS